MNKSRAHQKQRGGVSLFVVIFAMMLFTIIAVGFVRLMVRDQQQASATNLSQAAGDAAQTGVEDGKRAILAYLKNGCAETDTAGACGTFNTTAATTCNAGISAMGVATPTDGQVAIEGATNYNEAYTCVQISMNTPNYVGQLAANNFTLIPLDTGTDPYDTVTISWHSAADQGTTTTTLPTATDFPLMADWVSKSYPAILEAQMMQVPRTGNLSLSDLEAPSDDVHTVFLYPSSSITSLLSPLADDPSGKPSAVKCNTDNLATGGYACVATMQLPAPIGGAADNRYTLLRLGAFYTGTHYQVVVTNAGTPVTLKGVEPSIDSTGRAADLFKRVQSRVILSSIGFQYPSAAVDTTGSFCKTFSVTDDPSDYSADPDATDCTP